MLVSLLLTSAIATLPQMVQGRPGARPVVIGWGDELNTASWWSPLPVGNKPAITTPVRGAITLTLRAVPQDWPYEYQWSGVTREADVDIARYPFLTAYVPQLLGGYAHMDIDALDSTGRAVKTIRSSTLQAGGVTFVDLSSQLDPATYRLALRLIVGGSNRGCWCTYDWVRFTSKADGEILRQSPDWKVFARQTPGSQCPIMPSQGGK